MDDKQALLEELRRRLENCTTRIAEMKTRLGHITSRTAAEFDEQMTALRRDVEHAREAVGPLAESGGRAWSDLKTGFDTAWRDLRDAFETATTRW